jgi:hypothetical protein
MDYSRKDTVSETNSNVTLLQGVCFIRVTSNVATRYSDIHITL